MSLFDQMMKDLSQLENMEQLSIVLEEYYIEAETDPIIYNELINVAEYYAQTGYRDMQIEILTVLYEIKLNSNIIYLISKAYYEYAQFEEAYAWIKRLDGPLRNKTSLLEARILIELGDMNQAKDLLLANVKKFPTKPQAYVELAELYLTNHIYDKAEYFYQTAFDYFKDQVDGRTIRLKLVEIEISKEVIDIEKIEKLMLSEALPVENSEEAFILALAYKRAFQFQQAITYAAEAIAMDYDFLDARLLLMELYVETGQKEGLKDIIHLLANALPSYHETILEVADAANKIQEFPQVLINKMIDYCEYTDDAEEQYKIISYLVRYKIATDKPQDALHYLKTLAGAFEDELVLSYLFAITYEKLNMMEYVEKFYLLALEQMAPESELVSNIVKFYQTIGDIKRAFEVAEKYKHSIYDTAQLKSLRTQMRKTLSQDY
ncbi:tetratricopeptide repeat protein [Fundicoccus sp. Sow4_F4]|uniref:tetratricopeptide repeat protein n=1 Tax=Fundicoccus sp. Sow4_F4 TaxID=3438783 RepID=UPI003F8EF6B5